MCFAYLFAKFSFSSCLLPFLSFINSSSVSFHLLIRYHRYIIIITKINYCYYYYCFFPCYKHVFNEMRLKQNKNFVSMISCGLSPEPTPPPPPLLFTTTLSKRSGRREEEGGRAIQLLHSLKEKEKEKKKKKKKRRRKKGGGGGGGKEEEAEREQALSYCRHYFRKVFKTKMSAPFRTICGPLRGAERVTKRGNYWSYWNNWRAKTPQPVRTGMALKGHHSPQCLQLRHRHKMAVLE